MLQEVFNKMLVISPHADDDVIGCGGLMKKVLDRGGQVFVTIVAIGDIRFRHLNRVVTKEERKKEAEESLGFLGVTDYFTLFDDYESLLDTMPVRNLVTALEDLVRKLQPNTVLLPYPSFHQDHKTVYNAGFAALRPSPANPRLRLVAAYEYPLVSWTDSHLQNGNLYVDITGELESKITAFKLHKSQARPGRHLLSPETVAAWAGKRGLEAGTDFAELFYVLRMLL